MANREDKIPPPDEDGRPPGRCIRCATDVPVSVLIEGQCPRCRDLLGGEDTAEDRARDGNEIGGKYGRP